jgi:hypothetical protein
VLLLKFYFLGQCCGPIEDVGLRIWRECLLIKLSDFLSAAYVSYIQNLMEIFTEFYTS